MKLSALLLLFAAAFTAIAQSTAAPSQANLSPSQIAITGDNQVGCPVVLTSAWLTPYLMLLRAGSAPLDDSGGIDLRFRNASGKEIRSMEFDAVFLAKKSIYDINGVKITLHLAATGTDSIDDTFEHLRHLSLPERTNPVLVDNVTLEQVTFADGSVWTAKSDGFCGFAPSQTLPVAR